MSPVVVPQYVLLSSARCPLTAECGQYYPFNDDVPRAPRPRLLELPPSPSLHTRERYHCTNKNITSTTSAFHNSATHPAFNTIYPINLISTNLTSQQRMTLWDIGLLHLPLHIHTPTAHIGTICADNISGCMYETLNAVAVIELLRSLVCAPLELQPTFVGLQPVMRNLVRDAFYKRTSGPGKTLHLAHCDAIWSRFMYGYLDRAGTGVGPGTCVGARIGPPASPPPPGGRPLGRDLLLGNCNVWGFERASFNGCDVVHLG